MKMLFFNFFVFVIYVLTSCNLKKDKVSKNSLNNFHNDRVAEINNMAVDTIDEEKINTLIKSGNKLKNTNPDSALSIFKEALIISKESNYTRGIAVSLLNLGSCTFNNKKDYRKSKEYFFSAIPYCQLIKQEDEKLLTMLYDGIANVYFMEDKYDSAVNFYYQSLIHIHKTKPLDTALLLHAYSNIGSAIGSMGQIDRALHYFQNARKLAVVREDSSQLARIYGNLGSAYGKKGNDSSLMYFVNALNLYQALNYNDGIQNLYNHIATIWLLKKDIKTAKLYLDSAVNTDMDAVNKNYELLQNLGCVHYFSRNFKKAIPYYEQSLKLSEINGVRKSKLNAYATLAALHDSIGEGSTAYKYQVAYSELKDSLINEDKIKIVNQFEIKYRTSEKDNDLYAKQLLIAQQQNKINQQYLWIGGALLFISALLSMLYIKRHKTTIAQLKATLAGEEKERLRMASELHDGIVSKLSSVKMHFEALSSSYSGDVDSAEDYKDALVLLDQSISELRTTSQNLQPTILKKAGLSLAVDIYCQKISKISNLDISFQVVGELPPLKEDFQLNIYRIIQELINNMLKHSHASHALIQFNVQNDKLSITIEDNGIGITNKKTILENGIGLFNLHNRVKFLNGTIEIANKNGTSVYMDFGLKKFMYKNI